MRMWRTRFSQPYAAGFGRHHDAAARHAQVRARGRRDDRTAAAPVPGRPCRPVRQVGRRLVVRADRDRLLEAVDRLSVAPVEKPWCEDEIVARAARAP
jgi:hypothetical protein